MGDSRMQLLCIPALKHRAGGGWQVLATANVVHFDLKCDNVLLEAAAGASEAEFWRPASARPPFRVVLADFGESRMYSSAQAAVTVRCAALNA